MPRSFSFSSANRRERFEADNPGCHAAASPDAEDAIGEALDRFGRLDAAFGNDTPLAGSGDAVAPVDRVDFAAVVDALLVRPYRFVQAAIDAMVPRGGGRILIATSGAAYKFPHRSSDGNPGYIAARAGANAMAQSLAVRHAADNIRLNVIAPFYLYGPRVFPSAIGPDDPAYAERLAAEVPMGRFGRPEEAGALVAFLLSPDSMFVSGQIVAFSGAGA